MDTDVVVTMRHVLNMDEPVRNDIWIFAIFAQEHVRETSEKGDNMSEGQTTNHAFPSGGVHKHSFSPASITSWLGILIFGSNFWDPHWMQNSNSVFNSEDSGRKIFVEFHC